MASEKWWNSDGYGNQAIRASISLWASDDGETSVKIHATGGAETYNSTGYGGSWINFAGHEESGGCYGYSDNYYWAHSSWWWSDYNLGTFNKTHETQTVTGKCYFVYGRWPNDTLEATATYTISKKANYAVKYSLDGGSGTFNDQTKWHGENLTLHSGSPTKSGFLFKGWTGSNGTTYQPGATYTGNSALTLTAIWQAAVTDLEDVEDIEVGENPSFSWTPQSASLTYKIKLSLGTWSWASDSIAPATTSKYTYNSYTVPMEVCNQITDQVSGLMTAELETYNGGTKTGSSEVQFVVSVPSSVVPTISSASAVLEPDNGLHAFLQNRSKVKGTLQCTVAYSSPIVEAEMTIGEDTKTVVPEQDPLDPTKYTAEIISDVLPNSGSITCTQKITDARGRTKTFSSTITVYEYSDPTADISITFDGQSEVDAVITPHFSSVGGLNAARLSINGGTPRLCTDGMPVYLLEISPYFHSRNYTCRATIIDLVTSDIFIKKLYPEKGNRFETLSEDQFYVCMDGKGWKDVSTSMDGGIEDEMIWFQREGYKGEVSTDPVGIGMPLILDPNSDYELIYSVNEINDTAALVSFFWDSSEDTSTETDFTYISTTENLRPGDMFHTPAMPTLEEDEPEMVLWGIITLGAMPTSYEVTPLVYREFTNVVVRKVEEETESLDWVVETGNLGLDTPLQKYISKVVIRMAFEGTMAVWVSYDGGAFSKVYEKTSATLRSYDIPINVKRCDHFRFRISGTGVSKIYSIGYSEESGSEVC